ncbi:MAG: hypothetical protein HY815_15895 [Candidatus Riflebacteria bacterium]|nr:hypothetical protein [Candidatus Riflebacteria bacterium]
MVRSRPLSVGLFVVLALTWPGSLLANGGGVMAAPPPSLLKIAPDSVETVLRGAAVSQVTVDSRGTVWAATKERGLARKDARAADWVYLTKVKGELPEDSLSQVILFKDKVWIGFATAGVARLDPGALTRFTNAAGGLPGDEVINLAVFQDTLWVLTDGGPAKLVNDTFEAVAVTSSPAPAGQPSCLYAPGDGKIYIGTDAAEVLSFDGKAWERFDFKGRVTGRIVRCAASAAGWLWFGTFGSLNVQQLVPGGKLHDETNEKAVLFPVRVITGLERTPDTLLIGSSGGGLYRLTVADRDWRLYCLKNGLVSNAVNNTTVVGKYAYVATAEGVSRIDLSLPLPPAPKPRPSPSPGAAGPTSGTSPAAQAPAKP